ncbi:GntR family transcriptional regulator [Paenibacillus sp. RC84]|uniref:GntR family transcriptional regulator n=1 Tax=Paenibacillus sp. RC84 TaxID=3156252 RepID=UPI0035163C17
MKTKPTIQRIKRQSFREEIYEALRQAIVSLELEPGAKLSDQELAEQFGVSRTPVREALKRLEDDGLVEAVPGSATRVTPLKPKEGRHAFTVVAALHALAARLAVPYLGPEEYEALEQSNKALEQALGRNDVPAAIEADNAFHAVFLQAAGNPEILSALKGILPKVQRLEISRFASVHGLQSVEQHRRIADACRKRDAADAARLVEENWLTLGERLAESNQAEKG